MAATPSNPIILYDIPASTELKAWAINIWKTRLLLNLKGLPYRTEWVSYPDIQPTFEKLGIKHTSLKTDGSGRPHYTCPAIIDPTSPEPTKLSDSTPIALYIEETYPNVGPKVFPDASKDAQLEFIDTVVWDIIHPISSLVTAQVPAILDPRGSEYFYRERSALRGKPLETVCLAGSDERKQAWEDLKRGLDAIAKIYDRNVEGKGEYFAGSDITYADIYLAAIFLWARIPSDRDQDLNVDSVWGGIAKLNDGRWEKFMQKFEGLLQVN
ncbi:hypothetical protein M407DRAFT_16645 [Tulasnella calospora MUT 4182]|uniref:GST N-terminal domain-containing protein n=1 Tax=Tulasnella calospora MUT 4182 TaxID=1051891 RepID=A0A0C3LKM4_9AGAM|nr:hypothetical protein M407DRAFT_16645 [Tulasnella calospora MUT 4182]